MPSTSPEMVEYGFALNPGTETFMSIKAEVLQSVRAIENIDYAKRACYMPIEKSLRYYNIYAYLNCQLECTANYTFKVRTFFIAFEICSKSTVHNGQKG